MPAGGGFPGLDGPAPNSIVASARREIAGISADITHQLAVGPPSRTLRRGGNGGGGGGGGGRQVRSAAPGTSWHATQQRRSQLMKEVGASSPRGNLKIIKRE